MNNATAKTRFKAMVLRPANPGTDTSWAFLILPKTAGLLLRSVGLLQ
ncbi:MAG: hypothetical protein ACKVJU_00365 [Verrucomicrobiales bacterium]